LGIWLLTMAVGHAETESSADNASVQVLYNQHCAGCHHPQRMGGMGPALLPDNLQRVRPKEAADVIANGRPATQMPAFKEKLSPADIQALTHFIHAEPKETPRWDMADIRASHVMHNPREALPSSPVHNADPWNMFLVVELGDHHATVLDGDRLEPIYRFPTRFALHGGPKYGPNGRFVYMASRDGWVSQFDMYSLKMVSEVRAGINTRNLAISDDGHIVMVANYLPHTLVALDAATLQPLKVIPVVGDQGHTSRVSAVYTAPPRYSFIAALKDIPEVWEIPYNTQKAQPIYTATVHDFQAESGEKLPVAEGPFPIRRIRLQDYLDDFFFDQSYTHLIGASRDGGKGQVVNLLVGRTIATIDIPGMPHLGSGITWPWEKTTVLATPNLKEGAVTVIDLKTWKTVKRIPTEGPGFFMRSHENSPYAWVDVFFGPNRDKVHIIDKRTLTIVKTLQPEPGKVSAHVEFTRDGRYALLSIWEMDGAVIVYDAQTLKEIKRLPMKKPSGKYNVYNKVYHSEGTSH
jgi:cytochrome c553